MKPIPTLPPQKLPQLDAAGGFPVHTLAGIWLWQQRQPVSHENTYIRPLEGICIQKTKASMKEKCQKGAFIAVSTTIRKSAEQRFHNTTNKADIESFYDFRHPPSSYLIHWTAFLSLFYFSSIFTFLFLRAFKFLFDIPFILLPMDCKLRIYYTFSSYNKWQVYNSYRILSVMFLSVSGFRVFLCSNFFYGSETSFKSPVVCTSFFYFLSFLSLIF